MLLQLYEREGRDTVLWLALPLLLHTCALVQSLRDVFRSSDPAATLGGGGGTVGVVSCCRDVPPQNKVFASCLPPMDFVFFPLCGTVYASTREERLFLHATSFLFPLLQKTTLFFLPAAAMRSRGLFFFAEPSILFRTRFLKSFKEHRRNVWDGALSFSPPAPSAELLAEGRGGGEASFFCCWLRGSILYVFLSFAFGVWILLFFFGFFVVGVDEVC